MTRLPVDGANKSYLPFIAGSYDVQPFTVFHDALEPVGYLVRSRVDGDKLAFATDTVNLRYRFPGVNILAVECNYAYDILDHCTRLQRRCVTGLPTATWSCPGCAGGCPHWICLNAGSYTCFTCPTPAPMRDVLWTRWSGASQGTCA